MKSDMKILLNCAAMLAACACSAVLANTDRPGQTGVACARAGNSYCQTPQPLADSEAHAVRPGSGGTTLQFLDCRGGRIESGALGDYRKRAE